jgi:hypothetical protein
VVPKLIAATSGLASARLTSHDRPTVLSPPASLSLAMVTVPVIVPDWVAVG